LINSATSEFEETFITRYRRRNRQRNSSLNIISISCKNKRIVSCIIDGQNNNSSIISKLTSKKEYGGISEEQGKITSITVITVYYILRTCIFGCETTQSFALLRKSNFLSHIM